MYVHIYALSKQMKERGCINATHKNRKNERLKCFRIGETLIKLILEETLNNYF